MSLQNKMKLQETERKTKEWKQTKCMEITCDQWQAKLMEYHS